MPLPPSARHVLALRRFHSTPGGHGRERCAYRLVALSGGPGGAMSAPGPFCELATDANNVR